MTTGIMTNMSVHRHKFSTIKVYIINNSTYYMPLREVADLNEEQWKLVTEAFKRGPTPKQQEVVKQAIRRFMFDYTMTVETLSEKADELAGLATEKPTHSEELTAFAEEVKLMSERLEIIGKRARTIQNFNYKK